LSAAVLRFPIERVLRPEPAGVLRARALRLSRRAKLLMALQYCTALRLARDEETRWHYALWIVDYRRMAHDLAEDIAECLRNRDT
jgi:hypothetical protein